MKQAMGYSALAGKRNVINELGLYVQAIWVLSRRALAKRFGSGQSAKRGRVRSQAHYKPRGAQNTTVNASPNRAADTRNAMIKDSLPDGTLTEIRSISYLGTPCSAEVQAHNLQQGLKQMLPAVASFCQQRWLVLVAPPCLPSADELTVAGIDPARVLLVHVDISNGLAVLEQALRAGTCGAVLAWLEKGDVQTLDRLRKAAEAGNAWTVLFRTAQQKSFSQQASMVSFQQAENVQLKIAIN